MTAVAAAIAAVRAWPRWLTLSLACLAFVLVFGLPTIIVPLGADQILYSLGARTILDGGQLYRDLWEIKPPLVFLIYTVPFAIAGVHMEAVRVFDLLNTALAMAAVYLLARRFFGERAGLLAAAFYGFTYLAWSPNDSLAETESFIAAPLALAFWLYLPDDTRRDAPLRAFAAGLLLGAVFALKTSALLFVLALPAAELLLQERRTGVGVAGRLALAALGFLLVQAVLGVYLAVAGVLDDFFDIQRNYTLDYNAYRLGGHSHLRFLLDATQIWLRSAAFLTVPAFAAVLFTFFRPRQARAATLVAVLAVLALAGVWWQGKMFDYHWLVAVPLLAILAGYAVDQLLELFGALPRPRSWAAAALLAGGLLALATQPLLNTYDEYRTLARYANGSMSRREVEAHYLPLYSENHQLVDYVRANSGPDDRIFIWGFWPQVNFWLDRPLFDRFVANHGLRATWAPQSWRDELIDDLVAHPPRYIAVGQGDSQPWLVGTSETSEQHLQNNFPALRLFLDSQYHPVLNVGIMVLYERRPAAVRAGGRSCESLRQPP